MTKVNVFVKERMEMISIWHKAALHRKSIGNKDWEKTFMSPITWENLRTALSGFLGYCNYMLINFPHIHYICALSGNTSVIESIFSEQRAMGNENCQRFTSGVATLDVSKAHNSLIGKKTYDPEQAKTTSIGKDLSPLELTNLEKERTTWIKQWDDLEYVNLSE